MDELINWEHAFIPQVIPQRSSPHKDKNRRKGAKTVPHMKAL